MERYGERWQQGRQGGRRDQRAPESASDGRPTVRQVYAVARALCARCGEEFPETRAAASELIDRLRAEGPGDREAA